MNEYCEEFRALEAQIYDMAFADRLNNFLQKLPVEGALYIRNAARDTRDMEVIYRIAREWATNVRSTIGGFRRHPPSLQSNRPRLLKHVQIHKPPDKKVDTKVDSDEELDVMHAEEDKIFKAEMSQVTCY